MERRAGRMMSVGDYIERNIELYGGDVLTVKGYTQVPNHVLVSNRLSPGAKLTYAMILKYAWEKDFSFPGQDLGGGSAPRRIAAAGLAVSGPQSDRAALDPSDQPRRPRCR